MKSKPDLEVDSPRFGHDFIDEVSHIMSVEEIIESQAKAMATGKPIITANQAIPIRITGRRHFGRLIGAAFTLLFEGQVTMRFRSRSRV